MEQLLAAATTAGKVVEEVAGRCAHFKIESLDLMAEPMNPGTSQYGDGQAEHDRKEDPRDSLRTFAVAARGIQRTHQQYGGTEHPEQWRDADDSLEAGCAAAQFAMKDDSGPISGAVGAIDCDGTPGVRHDPVVRRHAILLVPSTSPIHSDFTWWTGASRRCCQFRDRKSEKARRGRCRAGVGGLNLRVDPVRAFIEGRAKAMIVTSSRVAGLRYFNIIKEKLRERGAKYKVLYAFSDFTHPETNAEIHEHAVNELKEGELIEERFEGEDYRLMVVANKFQTGFDQPLLALNVPGQARY